MPDEAIIVLVSVLATGAVSLAVQWFTLRTTGRRDVEKEKRQRRIEYNLRMTEPASKVLERAVARSKHKQLMEIFRKASKEEPSLKGAVELLNELDSQNKGKEMKEIWYDDSAIVASVLDDELQELLTKVLVGQIGKGAPGIPNAGTPEYYELLRAAHDRIRKLVTEVD